MVFERGKLATLIVFLAVCRPAAAAEAFVGKRVSDILRTESKAGLEFVFSSALVPESLRITQEPAADLTESTDRLRLVRSLLAQHDLVLRIVQPGLYAVAQAPQKTETESPLSLGLQEVVVSASRYHLAAGPDGAMRLDDAGLSDQPAPGNDPLRAIARLPGIVQDGLSAEAHVRGGESNETLLLLDGFPLRRPFHLASYQPLFSVVDASLLSSADVFTGGFPVRYGNRMSGVFDLHTLTSTDLPRRSIAIDAFNLSGLWGGRSERTGTEWLTDARIGTLAPLLDVFAPNAGSPSYSDAFLRLGWGDVAEFRLTANVLWAKDGASARDHSRGEIADIEDLTTYVWVRADKKWNENLTGSVWLGRTQIDSQRIGTLNDPGIATGEVNDLRNSTLWDLRARFDWKFTLHQSLQWGTELTQERARYSYDATASYEPIIARLFDRQSTFDRDLELSPLRRRTALFADHRWELGYNWYSEIGIRGEAVVTNGLETRWTVDPRLGLRWEPRVGTRIHLNYGSYHQADEVSELKVEDGLTNFPKPQQSTHLIAGLEQQIADEITIRGEIFSKRQTDPRPRFENIFNRRTILSEISPDRIEVLPDYAELKGVELSVDHRHERWLEWTTIGWSMADDEAAGVQTARSWDTRWSISSGFQTQMGPWSFKGAGTFRRGFPTTSLDYRSTDYVLGPFNAERLPNYLGVDLRADYRQQTDAGSLVYTMELFNAFDQPNDCCTDLVASGNTLALRRVRGLPMFPSIGLRWTW